VIDLGMVVRTQLVARVMEEWLADREISIASMRLAIDRHAGRGRRGVRVARTALEGRVLGDERPDSTDEHLIPLVLREYGSPAPVHHHLVRRNGRVIAELDYAYVPEKVAIELLGYNPHTRTRRSFEDFLARQNLLQDEGWIVRGYTPSMVRARPWQVAAEIERCRLDRSP
jgi:hypothetical protein